VTLNIGVATVIPLRDSSASVLLAAADAALYTAKNQGRNQAVLASASTA
jgi:PleD family two-component response regulator